MTNPVLQESSVEGLKTCRSVLETILRPFCGLSLGLQKSRSGKGWSQFRVSDVQISVTGLDLRLPGLDYNTAGVLTVIHYRDLQSFSWLTFAYSHIPPDGCTSAPNQSAAKRLAVDANWEACMVVVLESLVVVTVERNAEGYCPHKSVRIQQPRPGRAVNHTRHKLWCFWSGPNFIELLKHKKPAKHNKMILTRIRSPAKLPWLVSCSFLLSRKMLSNIFCLSSSMKLGPEFDLSLGLDICVLTCLHSLTLSIPLSSLLDRAPCVLPYQCRVYSTKKVAAFETLYLFCLAPSVVDPYIDG